MSFGLIPATSGALIAGQLVATYIGVEPRAGKGGPLFRALGPKRKGVRRPTVRFSGRCIRAAATPVTPRHARHRLRGPVERRDRHGRRREKLPENRACGRKAALGARACCAGAGGAPPRARGGGGRR